MLGYDALPVGGGLNAFTINGYRVKYFEDIKLTGISASTKIGETQVGAEWSYRDGAPVMVNTALGAVPAKGKGQQMQLSAMRILGDRPWASQTTLTAEVIRVQVDSVESTSAAPNLLGVNLLPSVGALVGPSNDYTYNTSAGWRTKASSAYTVGASFSYPGVFQGLNNPLTVTRYHSLVVKRETLPDCLELTAWTQLEDGSVDETYAESAARELAEELGVSGVAQAHDLVNRTIGMLRPGREFQALRQGFTLDHQRVVAGHGQWVVQPLKNTCVQVIHRAGFTVHDLPGANDIAAKSLTDGLMPEAHAQNRQLAGKMFNRFKRDARLVRRAWAG